MAETPGQPVGRPPGQPGARRVGRVPASSGRETAGQRAEARPQGSDSEVRIRTAARSSSGGGRTASLASASRRPSADDRRYWLSSRLTERDRELLRALERVGVLTASQVAAMFFASESRARARLAVLHDSLGVVARFRPLAPQWGSAPFHYVLSKAGAGVVAAERGEDPAAAERRWSTGRRLALADSRHLAHTVGANGFFAALAGEARRNPRAELVRWLAEWECAKACSTGPYTATSLRPDGWLLWREGGEQVEAFLEYDRGTEALRTLAAKLRGYAELEGERGVAAWVLFAFESARREGTARRALAGATVAVATAALAGGARPSDAVWLPLRSTGPRLRLAALAGVPLPAEARVRIEGGRGRTWLYAADFYGEDEQPPPASAESAVAWLDEDEGGQPW
jgi:hypothetical protein